MSKIAPRIFGGSILAGLGYIAYNLFTDGFQEVNSEGDNKNSDNNSILLDTKDMVEDTNNSSNNISSNINNSSNSSNSSNSNSSSNMDSNDESLSSNNNTNENTIENNQEVTDNEIKEINNEGITEVSLDGIDINNAVENVSLDTNDNTNKEETNESTETKSQNFIERVIQV